MEPIVCSETSAISTQMPGKYPKENALHIKHGESLKSRTVDEVISLVKCNLKAPDSNLGWPTDCPTSSFRWYTHSQSLFCVTSCLIQALHYKPQGRGFNPRWCHWNFSLTSSFRPQNGPGVDSATNRNEYQEYFLRGKGGRCVGLTTLPLSCADYLEIWEP